MSAAEILLSMLSVNRQYRQIMTQINITKFVKLKQHLNPVYHDKKYLAVTFNMLKGIRFVQTHKPFFVLCVAQWLLAAGLSSCFFVCCVVPSTMIIQLGRRNLSLGLPLACGISAVCRVLV